MEPQKPKTYEVKAGDNLSGIAKSLGLSSYKALSGYASGNPDMIQPGEILTINDNQMSVGSGPASSEFVKQSGELQNMLSQLGATPGVTEDEASNISVDNYSDSYTQALDTQAQSADQSTQALIRSMQAQNQNLRNNVAGEYDDYKRGLMSLGIQTNSAQSTPDLLMGHIQKAQNDYVKEISGLDRQENIARMEAESARADNNLGLLKEKMSYIKEIKAEKRDALKRSYEKMSLEADISTEQVDRYYEKMQTLNDEDKEDFLIALSDKFNIPVQALVRAIADKKESIQDKADKKNKDSESSNSGGYTSQEERKLRQAGIDPTDIVAADDFLYGDSEGGTITDVMGSIAPARIGSTLDMSKSKARKLAKQGLGDQDITEFQKYFAQGYSLKQVADKTGMPQAMFELLSKYVNEED